MPAIPSRYRKWLYATGVAFVPVAVGFGWLQDEMAPAVVGLVYAVFMGGLAAANVPSDES